MAAFSWFAGQRPLSSLARQASVKVALQSMSAFVRVMIKAGCTERGPFRFLSLGRTSNGIRFETLQESVSSFESEN